MIKAIADRLAEATAEYIHELIRKDLNNKDFSKAVSRILKVADDTNSYINNKTPWKLNDDDALEVATTGISIYKDLCILFMPIMPSLASKALAQVKIENPAFDDHFADSELRILFTVFSSMS